LVPRFGFTDTHPGTEESLLRSRSEFFITIYDVCESATQIMSTRGQRDILSVGMLISHRPRPKHGSHETGKTCV
jgi:hypothetical protein